VIVSDGGLPHSGLPALPSQVRYVPIGTSQNNLAISALALRPTQIGPELFARVSNYDNVDHRVLLSIYSNDTLFDAKQLDVPAGKSADFTLEDLPNTSTIYKAHISDPEKFNSDLDVLALDDTAFAIYQSASARRVLLVSGGNLFLEQLLASLPGLQPFRALPAEDGTLQIPNDPFDLYIFDGPLPAKIPEGNILFVNPSSNSFFEVGPTSNEISNIKVNEDPLTRFVDWRNVHILQAQTVQHPIWANVLIESDAGPLVFAGQSEGRRIAAVTFDLRQSDLPLQVAYPILFSNLIDYLAPPSAIDTTRSLSPGEVLSILPPLDVERTVIASPSNQAYPLAQGQTTFTQTFELGYYAANFLSKESSRVEYFAVNIFEEAESNIQPRDSLMIGSESIEPTASQNVGLRELWKWLAILAILILMIEWQVYHRKTLPLHRPV
jgi:hypothetical protein